ncbi:MAG: phosphatase, partial [Alphaproteobacteria bacterium]
AVAFGQSRVVCGLHYPADFEAVQFIGSEVLAKSFEAPDFRRDLACARREIEAIRNGQKAGDLPACAPSP